MTEADEFAPASFPVALGLPATDDGLLNDARQAVRQEALGCSKWKRLRCRKVSVIAERDRGTVYAVHVGSSVEFDWTWEGAVAFRPLVLGDEPDGWIDMADFERSPVEESTLWSGEVLEVDEQNGCLFLRLDNPDNPPVVGSFFVRPFDFLATLDAVYHEPRFAAVRDALRDCLAAAAGGLHPLVGGEPAAVGLAQLQSWWRHSWSILWGPPGTGKTYTAGRQIAAVLNDPSERILVVSTTNRATDAVAVSIGRAAAESHRAALDAGHLARIGKGASPDAFRAAGLDDMLRATDGETLARVDALRRHAQRADEGEEKAFARKEILELRDDGADPSKRLFVDGTVRVVVATAFKATRLVDDPLVRQMLERKEAPFTTIFIDEAGLISRTAVAVLALLAARRVVLVGDSKQLAPISRIARVLASRQETWLAKSGLSHLQDIGATPDAVHVLSQQHRMHPDICRVVSEYQYGGVLTTAPAVGERASPMPAILADQPRAIWYVLDEEATDLASIRAERGPANRSWMRRATFEVLDKLFADPSLRHAHGLFVSPYLAQAQAVARWFAQRQIETWNASTVHSQQGAEADIVLFDTVSAGSCHWPYDEWKRLINVGLSRAREAIILLCSRNEMGEPYLRPLARLLAPQVLVVEGDYLRWQPVVGAHSTARAGPASAATGDESAPMAAMPKGLTPEQLAASGRLGVQIASRRLLRPVLSQEQQRLSNLELDGKPRLVRGVAGSGKTLVLSQWLAKTARRFRDPQDSRLATARIWAVYANRSLHKLLRESIEAAWADDEPVESFPWASVHLLHVKDVLSALFDADGLSMEAFGFEYDRAAEEFLARREEQSLEPRCRALFIDEAQDMGPHTLRLLLSLVEQSDQADRNSRCANIFFDNAQNIYGRRTPKWSEFGLDMRGRSTIMRESFRSTNPIMEYAVNVLHRLTPAGELHDHRELESLGLIERVERNGQPWLRVRFNQVRGPRPHLRRFANRDAELAALGDDLERLITKESVAASDICLIYNGQSIPRLLEMKLGPRLARAGVELSVQTNRPFERQPNTLVVTTSHSFKGYDAEVVFIPCADQYTTHDGQILAANLYVAMTRARSLLSVYATDGADRAAKTLNETLSECLETLAKAPTVDAGLGEEEDFEDLLERVGPRNRPWLKSLWSDYRLIQEPLFDGTGRVIAEPLFWFEHRGKRYACFASGPRSGATDEQLASLGIGLCAIGESIET